MTHENIYRMIPGLTNLRGCVCDVLIGGIGSVLDEETSACGIKGDDIALRRSSCKVEGEGMCLMMASS